MKSMNFLLAQLIFWMVMMIVPGVQASGSAFTGVVDYGYNALGQRVSKRVGGITTYYLYDVNGSRIAEVDGNGQVVKEYLYMHGEPVAEVNDVSGSNPQILYSHNDHLGTPLMLTNQNQDVVWQGTRTPFGEVVEESGNAGVVQQRGFPGQYHDRETSAYYNYYRDYDAELGRYMQSDPIGLKGGMNTYAYVGGNPLSAIDPNGQSSYLLIPGAIALGGLVSLGACTQMCVTEEAAKSTDIDCDKMKLAGNCLNKCKGYISLMFAPTSPEDVAAEAAEEAGEEWSGVESD